MEQPDGAPSENEVLKHVTLIPKAHAALLEMTMNTSVSQTDALNRAVQLANRLEKLKPGEHFQWLGTDDQVRTVMRTGLKKKGFWKRFWEAMAEGDD